MWPHDPTTGLLKLSEQDREDLDSMRSPHADVVRAVIERARHEFQKATTLLLLANTYSTYWVSVDCPEDQELVRDRECGRKVLKRLFLQRKRAMGISPN